MCGLAGLLIKDPSLEPELGTMLASMICALADRGPDSAGFGVYARGANPERGHATRLSLAGDDVGDWDAVGASLRAEFGTDVQVALFDHAAIVEVYGGLGPHVEKLLSEMCPSPRVVGRGASVAVIKAIGRPEQICRRSRLPEWSGYLAIAHTRMATESAVHWPTRTLSSRPGPLRGAQRFVLQLRHVSADVFGPRVSSSTRTTTPKWRPACWPSGLELGDDLEEATRWVMKEMDGFFTLVITSAGRHVGGARRVCLQAGGRGRDAGYVAVASEYRALAELPGIAGRHRLRAPARGGLHVEPLTWTDAVGAPVTATCTRQRALRGVNCDARSTAARR